MDDHPRQNPAYRPATEKALETGLFLYGVVVRSRTQAEGSRATDGVPTPRRRLFGVSFGRRWLPAALALCFVGAGIWWRASSEPTTAGLVVVGTGLVVVAVVALVARS